MTYANQTAAILIQALPYIRRFTGKTLVVKVGGLPMTDPERARSLAEDVLLLHSVGIRVVLVHGGGPQIDEQMARQGIAVQRVEGLRVTDAEALDVVRMVLVGKINRELVSAVNALEPVAVGVAGEDGRLLETSPVDPALGFVGKVEHVRAGLLEDPTDPDSLVHRLSAAEARRRIADTSVTGGMIPKLAACAEAVEGGVGSAHMIDGRAEHAILIELFTDAGVGTMVTA